MRELEAGLWHWQAPHPDWRSNEPWDRNVSSYAIESHRAVIAGDTLVDFGSGLGINPRWLHPDMPREQFLEGLRPLLELPVEHVLPALGLDRVAQARERRSACPRSSRA